MTDLRIKRCKWYPGCYRITSPVSDVFGQIKKVGQEWQAEIRFKLTGDMKQFAGNWKTLADAQDECETHIRRACII